MNGQIVFTNKSYEPEASEYFQIQEPLFCFRFDSNFFTLVQLQSHSFSMPLVCVFSLFIGVHSRAYGLRCNEHAVICVGHKVTIHTKSWHRTAANRSANNGWHTGRSRTITTVALRRISIANRKMTKTRTSSLSASRLVGPCKHTAPRIWHIEVFVYACASAQ